MLSSKHALLGAGVLAAAYGASYLFKLNRLSNELETETKVSIYRISLAGIELKIDVTLKNPSGGSVKVKYPYVKLLYGDTTIASSAVNDSDITIPKFNEVKLEPLMITIGFMKLATTVPGLLKEYRSTGKLTLIVKTVTTINGSVPYSNVQPVTLGNGKPA